MAILEVKTLIGLESVKGIIFNGYGIWKNSEKRFCCIILEGKNKGIRLCSCSKLKLIKSFINELENIVNIKDISESNYNSDVSIKIGLLQYKYSKL